MNIGLLTNNHNVSCGNNGKGKADGITNVNLLILDFN